MKESDFIFIYFEIADLNLCTTVCNLTLICNFLRTVLYIFGLSIDLLIVLITCLLITTNHSKTCLTQSRFLQRTQVTGVGNQVLGSIRLREGLEKHDYGSGTFKKGYKPALIGS